jgi:hypothetical protein
MACANRHKLSQCRVLQQCKQCMQCSAVQQQVGESGGGAGVFDLEFCRSWSDTAVERWCRSISICRGLTIGTVFPK